MIKIQNVYHMLAYAYSNLNKSTYKNIAAEEFDNVTDLLAAIFINSLHFQLKHGLNQNYVKHTEARTSPKGKLNISTSIKTNAYMKKQLSCSYATYTENTYMNQVLKSIMMLLIHSDNVSNKNKKSLKKILLYFSHVHQTDLKQVRWSSFTFHRNNITYRLLMDLCYIIVDGLLLTEESGKYRLANFIDDSTMHHLFERFVLKYYRKHFPELKPKGSFIQWDVDDDVRSFLPSMRTDITLTLGERTLIIDTKMYQKTMQTYYNSVTFHSQNMYQIFTYVKNKDLTNSGNVAGTLLYAKTAETIVPNHDFSISGNNISVKTIDLNKDFTHIKKQLNDLLGFFYN